MSDADILFMKQVGNEPCDPTAPEAQTPSLPEKAAHPLANLMVMREQEPESEPGFELPKTLPEYIARYPDGILEATKLAARELRLVPMGGFDGWAKGITEMFLGFLQLGLEDVVAMYAFPLRPIPGGCESERFHNYIGQRVKAALPVLLRDEAA